MKTFDDLRESGVKIAGNERETLGDMERILHQYREILGDDYKIILGQISSMGNSLKEISSLVNVLHIKAIMDPIGIYSKIYLEDRIATLQEESNLAFFMGDVDKFKNYNENYGHVQADEALRVIAREFHDSITVNTREGEFRFVARYGGEELCAFIGNYQGGLKRLGDITEDTRKNIENLKIEGLEGFSFKDEGYRHSTITISAGIRKIDEPMRIFMDSVDRLLTQKDEKGRNRTYLRE